MSSKVSTSTPRRSTNKLPMIPPEFSAQRKGFEDVAPLLKKIDELLESDASKTTQYSETWDGFSKEFQSIIASMREIATSVELCINDSVNTEGNDTFVAAPDTGAVKGKQGQLAQLEEGLRGVSGVNVQKFIDISERVSRLTRGIASFEFRLKSPNTMKSSTEVCDEMIRDQTHPSNSNIMSSLNLTERCWNVISAPFGGMQFSGVQKQYGNSKSDGTLSRTAESGGQAMDLKQKQELESRFQREWATVINECYTQIGAIKDSLDPIKCLWMALSAYAQELLTQLSFIVTRDNVALFNITLGNLEVQYKEASKAFHEFTHHESIQQAAQASSLSLPQPQLSTQQQSWFRRKI